MNEKWSIGDGKNNAEWCVFKGGVCVASCSTEHGIFISEAQNIATKMNEIESMRQQLAAEIMRLEIALRIKTEEHKCCSEDLMKLRESEQSGWKEAAIAWEVCGSIHEAFAKKKDALYSTRHSDFERHAEDARRMLSTESKEKVE